MRAKVSVIVPVYNVEDFLPKCLDALIGQTLKDIKIICVDDGSTDGSLDVLNEYKKKDKRIVVITKKNGGLSSARNVGLKKCDTEYVMFCDSDDYYCSEMCRRMLSAIDESNSDIAVCGMNVIYNAHKEMERSDGYYYKLKYVGKNSVNDKLILDTDVSVLNKIFRMDIIEKNKISFPEGLNNEDFYFYNAYMSVSETSFFVNQKLYSYIRRKGSIMSENFEAEKKSIDHLLVAEQLFDFYKKTGFLEKHKDLFWEQWVMSFWFSVSHSSDLYKKEIFNIANKFVKENYGEWKPSKVRIRLEVECILTDGVAKKVLLKIYNLLSKIYRRLDNYVIKLKRKDKNGEK